MKLRSTAPFGHGSASALEQNRGVTEHRREGWAVSEVDSMKLRSTAPFGHGSVSALEQNRGVTEHRREGWAVSEVDSMNIEQNRGVTEPRPQGAVNGHARGSETGNALIEFAASLILLAVMFAGIFEIGYSFYTYGTLVTAVRAGARYAALHPPGANADPGIAKAIRNVVVYGDPAPTDGAQPLVPGLSTDHVELISDPAASTVSLRGFEVDALFMKVKLEGRPTVTFPVTNGAAQ